MTAFRKASTLCIPALLLIGSLMGGCNESSSPDALLTGTFVDSPVINIGYRTETQSGYTDASGHFRYKAGETVTFYIGDIELPPVAASTLVTPLDIFNTTDVNNTQVVNLIRLLQSLDVDGEPSNGITVSALAHDSAAPVDFSEAEGVFELDPLVLALLQNGGQLQPVSQLVATDAAITNLQTQLNTFQVDTEDMVLVLIHDYFYDFGNVQGTYILGIPKDGSYVARILELNSGGSGTVKFGAGDINGISWQMGDQSILYHETDDSNDTWDVVISPIIDSYFDAYWKITDNQLDASTSALAIFRPMVPDATFDFAGLGGHSLTVSSDSRWGFSTKTLTFAADGTGTVDFGGGDINSIEWAAGGGAIHYLETDNPGNPLSDTWDVTITPIQDRDYDALWEITENKTTQSPLTKELTVTRRSTAMLVNLARN